MSFKRGLIQLWGFIVKSFLQRWRTPVLTILEIIMPCVFVILLSIVYWTATDTVIPASENNNAVAMNESAILWHLICQPPHASMTIIKELAFTNLVTSPNYPGQTAICDPTYDEFRCATYIGSGHDICVQSSEYSNIFAGSMYAAYYGSGSMGPDALEYYLILSAYLTEESNNLNPTFFGRGGKASYSHFGHILLASDDPALANEFIAHASSLSQVVASVIYPTIFSSYEAAEDYALANGNTVFAIVDLPSSSVQKTDINDPPVFTIGMNYSATAATYQESNRKKVLSRDWDSSEGYPLYRASGFLSLQTFVQSFYLQRYLKDTTKTQTGPAVYTGTTGIGSFLTSTGTPALIPLPSPERYENSFLSQWAYYMPLIAVMAVLFPVARLTGFIVEEKSLKIREAMLIMGLYPECNFGGWFTTTTVMNFVAALLASMILKIGFLKVVNYGVLLVLYFTFLQQCSAFAMALSTIFTNPRIAVWIAALIIFVCGIPYYTFPDGMSDVAKMFCCLVPCIGYGLSLNDMISFASFHKHYGWSEARIGGFNTAIAIGFMWFGWGVLIILTLYLDRVSPACVGVREHPLFFLKPLIRCFHKPKRETVYMSGRKHAAESGNPYNDDKEEEMGCVEDDVNEKLLTDKHDPYASWMEHYNEPLSPDNPDIAVLVSNLKKKYFAGGILGFLYTYFTGVFRKGDQVIALDDVTFAMRRGEISILLGPNGAGKSTVMGIATGLIRQTSGNVFIRGMDTKWEMGKCRQNIGYCPQEDIIWDTLTVIEHLRFYARLKDSNTFGVTDAATKAMELAGLAHKRNCKAKDLSGGQKRRLCVAIALVGDSSVLFLDEPTAGMDMIGRKSVYELLQKTRENRSTLISTHLLDEADRIGDRILIINHGNVVAEGSSLFLKSKADSGYTLTCLIDSGLSPEEENLAIANLNDYMREKTYPQHREPHRPRPRPRHVHAEGRRAARPRDELPLLHGVYYSQRWTVHQ
ncbi:ABC-2 family transporter protein/ABC transporter, putative [Angomonas deanei]|uniref:ABC-2 family transporter protein/ABC transporter, putative n=1 Tax=Angomonas deanei TaxID=59799 RepID=A0A7G2C653_9TRYP|nr:ABC-2 family transporter protein/ABC transporter, putative [Angomonas deanei]